jgi:hypothetical protein
VKAWLFRRFRFPCPFSLLHSQRFRKPPCDPGRSDFPSPVLALASLWSPSRSWRSFSADPHTPLPVPVSFQGRSRVHRPSIVRLLLELPSAQSPFALRGCSPVRDGVLTIEEGVPLPSSLLRAYAPVPIPPCACGDTPRSRGLCRLLAVSAGSGTFPTFSLRIFACVPGPLPRLLLWCTYPFLPTRLRPSPREDRVGAWLIFRAATSARPRISGLQSFTHVQARRFACHSGRSYHRIPRTLGSHGVSIRASHGSLPPRAPDMLAVRIGQLTAEDFHLLRFAALSAAPLTPAVSRRAMDGLPHG